MGRCGNYTYKLERLYILLKKYFLTEYEDLINLKEYLGKWKDYK
ncbi:hypothetical protein [Candidatus Endomicrobiellum trichonymphae]|nr:hypothetical protein [Candidatus Endomicrobium trichonymphae]